MTQIYRLESSSASDPTVGGLLFKFPSGKAKVLKWETKVPIDPMEGGKKYAAEAMNAVGIETDDARFTNWTSVVACIAKHLRDFNDKLIAHHHESPLLIGDRDVLAAANMGPAADVAGGNGSVH
jgi:hypothetical protein